MNKEYDYLIIGAGLFGSVCAHQLRLRGRRCLVIDKRNHIGGNCYTESIEGIPVHKYGGHIFHTNDITTWNYVNRLTEFNNYQHRIKVSYKNDLYSFPINLFTFYQIYGTVTHKEALEKLQEVLPENKKEKDNLESWAISQIGYDLYKIFIEGYTKKQWGEDPKNLPSNIIKRIPIRFT
jgi:UDP-galactopyranose mutase